MTTCTHPVTAKIRTTTPDGEIGTPGFKYCPDCNTYLTWDLAGRIPVGWAVDEEYIQQGDE